MHKTILPLAALLTLNTFAQDLPQKYQAIANEAIQRYYSLPYTTDESMIEEFGVNQVNYFRLLRLGYGGNQIRNLAHLQPAFRVIWHDYMPDPMPIFLGPDHKRVNKKR